jgi:hypothetical protein
MATFDSLVIVLMIRILRIREDDMNVNPRANGFNYGIGWGPSLKPAIYATAQELALELGELASRLSRAAWALEMAIRNVRLAETDVEKRSAVLALESEMGKQRRFFQAAE